MFHTQCVSMYQHVLFLFQQISFAGMSIARDLLVAIQCSSREADVPSSEALKKSTEACAEFHSGEAQIEKPKSSSCGVGHLM